MAVVMLSGFVQRLRFGALIANFSILFMLFFVFSLYALAKPSPLAAVAVVLLAVDFSLSPVAHVAYYYVGTLCKSLYENQRRGDPANESGELLVNEYVFFLDTTKPSGLRVCNDAFDIPLACATTSGNDGKDKIHKANSACQCRSIDRHQTLQCPENPHQLFRLLAVPSLPLNNTTFPTLFQKP